MVQVLVCILAACYYVQSVELPAYLQTNRCSQSSSTLDQCIIESANRIIPRLAEGLPSFDIPNMLPLKLEKVIMRDDQSLRFILKNVKVYGIENTKLTKSILDFAQTKTINTVVNPKINVSADYELDGHIANSPVKGNGKVSISLVNGEYPFEISFNVNEKQFARNVSARLSYTTENNQYHFTGLTIGKDSNEDTTNEFMNTHWMEVSSTFKQGASTAMANFVGSIFQKINNPLPLSELFLP